MENEKIYNWVKDNIVSSFTIWQLECCKVLIELFKKKYPEHNITELELLLFDQKNKINYV